jgi:hypothetical protein
MIGTSLVPPIFQRVGHTPGGARQAGPSIITDLTDSDPAEGGGAGGLLYEDFLPQLLAQHEGLPEGLVRALPSFDEAVDEFFARIEEQKLQQVPPPGVSPCSTLAFLLYLYVELGYTDVLTSNIR